MTDSNLPRHRCAGIAPGSHVLETAPARAAADMPAPAIARYPTVRVVRRLSSALLLVAAVGALASFARAVDARPTEVLLSNGSPPPSTRLLLVNVAQRNVAQEFTTGPHPAGYDIYAVAVRTENSNGKRDLGLQGRIRKRHWEPVGPWSIMLPHRQVGPTLTRSRPVADFDWSWFMSSEPIHLEPNETYFFELVCRWGCFAVTNRVGLGLTESNDEDDASLPGWSMANGFMIQNSRFNRWWGDMVVGNDGFFHPNPKGPVLRIEIRGEPREFDGVPSAAPETPRLSASDVQVKEAPQARLSFPVTLSSASARAVTVRYRTEDGTATAGTDYVPMAGRLVFAPGQTERTIEVPVIPDARKEGPETLTLRLLGAKGAHLADAQATGTIVNAGPKPREWLAGFRPAAPEQVVDVAGVRTDGGTAHVTTQRMQPWAQSTAAPRAAFAALMPAAIGRFNGDRYGPERGGAATTVPVDIEPDPWLAKAAAAYRGQDVSPDAPWRREVSAGVDDGRTELSPGLRLALSEPVSSWGVPRCGDR